ncbi:hypothetical protein FB451DRAFT_1057941, partial [Mycena latifolia]
KYPDEFSGRKRDSQRVTDLVNKRWPPVPAELPSIMDNDRLMAECIRLRRDGPPPFLLMRFAHAIPASTLARLLALWDRLKALGVKYPKADHRRSGMPALHLGVWELFMNTPLITTDSRQTLQSDREVRAEVVEAIDALCRLIRKLMVPRLQRLMDAHTPVALTFFYRIHARVRHFLGKALAQRPDMDFGGLFFTIAVKEGSSERVHIDWNDNLHKYAIIFCTGDYTGGEFCVPQLGTRVPLLPGSVIAARTRLLAHCSAPLSGRRIVFTCFTDCTLLEHTLEGRDFTVLRK